jgi:hypothetical protein
MRGPIAPDMTGVSTSRPANPSGIGYQQTNGTAAVNAGASSDFTQATQPQLATDRRQRVQTQTYHVVLPEPSGDNLIPAPLGRVVDNDANFETSKELYGSFMIFPNDLNGNDFVDVFGKERTSNEYVISLIGNLTLLSSISVAASSPAMISLGEMELHSQRYYLEVSTSNSSPACVVGARLPNGAGSLGYASGSEMPSLWNQELKTSLSSLGSIGKKSNISPHIIGGCAEPRAANPLLLEYADYGMQDIEFTNAVRWKSNLNGFQVVPACDNCLASFSGGNFPKYTVSGFSSWVSKMNGWTLPRPKF